MASSWTLPLRLALRELRGGLRGFRLFLACLALGAAAIAATGSLQESLTRGLEDNGRRLLGGDMELRLVQRPLAPEEQAFLAPLGRLSLAIHMRAMAYGQNDARSLVELKAVDDLYPLYGALILDNGASLADALAERNGIYGAVIEDVLARRLGLRAGDEIRMGEGRYQVRGIIAQEPDRIADGINLGPRMMVAGASLAQTGLLQPGSLVYYHYRLQLGPDEDTQSVRDALEEAFPQAGWRIRDWRNSNPGLRQFIDRMATFILFAALASLLIGGVGVGNAVSHYLAGKIPVIATLKAIGADRKTLLRAFILHMGILALIGIAGGMAVGAAVPYLVAASAAQIFPVALTPGLYPLPLGMALLFGLLVAALFTAWPLLRAADVRPAELFRERVGGTRETNRRALIVSGAIALALGLALFAVSGLMARLPMGGGDGSDAATSIMTEGQWFALWFIGGTIVSFLVLGLAARATVSILKKLPRPRGLAARMALSNLTRPGAVTASLLLSLGLGLSLISAIALIQGMIRSELVRERPQNAPAFFIADIQPQQWPELNALLDAIPGVEGLQGVPSLRGRIVRVNDIPAEEVKAVASEQWVLRGDRGLTYATQLPPNNRIVEGEWWPADYAGPPLLSMEDEAMRGLGLKIGDSLTVNILGRDITARIASSRAVDWGSLNLNFVLVFSPGVLEAAPQTWLATVQVATDPAQEEAVWRAITDRFANMSVVRVREVLQQAEGLIGNIGLGVQGVALISILSGFFVLAGAVAASQRARLRESAILKAVGADRALLLRACLAEYALVGAMAAFYGLTVGVGAAWILSMLQFDIPFRLDLMTLVALALLPPVMAALVGVAGSWGAFRVSVNAYLRTA